MSSIIRKVLLIVLIFVMFVFAGIKVGPVNLRNILSFFLLFYAVFNYRYISIDLSIKLYFLYLCVLILCNLINGEISHDSFVRYMLGDHLSSIAVIFSLSCLLRKKSDYKVLNYSLFIIVILNGIITILQFLNEPIGWAIAAQLSSANSEVLENSVEYMSVHGVDNSLNFALSAGLIGYVVANGYFNASFLPIFTQNILDKKAKRKNQILSFFLLLFSFVVIFAIQQRMAMICFTLYVLFIVKDRLPKWGICLIIILIVLFFSYYSDLNSDSVGRFSLDRENNDRLNLFHSFYVFLNSGNILFGGNDAYLAYAKGQHNTFLDVWVRGGLISLLAFIPFFYHIFKETFFNIFKTKVQSIWVVSASISCLFFLLYSQTHSVGLQSGSVFFWIPYMIIVSVKRKNKRPPKVLILKQKNKSINE